MSDENLSELDNLYKPYLPTGNIKPKFDLKTKEGLLEMLNYVESGQIKKDLEKSYSTPIFKG